MITKLSGEVNRAKERWRGFGARVETKQNVRRDTFLRIWPFALLAALFGLALILTPVGTSRLAFFGLALPGFCLFKLITGFACPFCGMSRSLVNLAHGNWRTAWVSHPLGPVFLLFVLAYSLYRLFYAKDPEHLSKWLAGISLLFVFVWFFRVIFPFLRPLL